MSEGARKPSLRGGGMPSTSPRRPASRLNPGAGVMHAARHRRRFPPEQGHVLMPGVTCAICAEPGPCRAWVNYLERPCDACGGQTELRVTGGGLRLYHWRELEPVDHRPVPELDVEADLPS